MKRNVLFVFTCYNADICHSPCIVLTTVKEPIGIGFYLGFFLLKVVCMLIFSKQESIFVCFSKLLYFMY